MVRVVGMVMLLLSLMITGGCSAALVPITVFAAASLADTLSEAQTSYSSVRTLTVSTGSSVALKTQIEQGAPADVFLSADSANPQALVDAGLADGAAIAFATNRLTIIVPTGNPGGIRSALDLARPGVKVITAGEDVPITRYATQLVANLAASPEYGPEFDADYAANIVSREDNVGAVTAKIELGEGDAAIVYITDARAADVETVEIPVDANVVATYAGAVIRSSSQRPAAHDFLAWLRGSDGQRVLSNHGFGPPE